MDADLSFGRWLKRRRKALDLTQDQLARQVGCAVGTIRKFESDSLHPSREIAARLAEQLAIPAEARANFIAFARDRARADKFSLTDQMTPIGGTYSGKPATPAPATHYPLPVPLTPLIGRAREIAIVSTSLQRADIRLLTLLGPPGVGKTRLALQVASGMRHLFAAGVCFVALASIHDPDLVAPAIAQALHVHETGDRSLVERLQAYVCDKQLLLVLDNVEHVVAAAPLIARLLAGAPALKVLSTSRTALRLYGEHEYVVPALELPDLSDLPPTEALVEYPAVALFQARAQAVQPNFAITNANAPIVAAICHRLDGLPLVIELAATRSKVFSPEVLLARLDQRLALLSGGSRDLPPRQQTLRGAIAWSYDLLDAPYQRLFAQFGVFVGSCTLEAAEAVLSTEDRPSQASTPSTHRPQPSVLDGLIALIDQSLIQQATGTTSGVSAEPRFTMLETIQEFALERLTEHDDEEVVRQRHAAYYMALAEQAEQAFQGADSQRWLDRLETEHDNLRAALTWSQSTAGDRVLGLRLAAALWWFWWARGYGSEGRRWLSQTLAQSQLTKPSAARAKALVSAGVLAAAMDVKAAREPLETALKIYRELGDGLGTAFPLVLLGWLTSLDGDQILGQAQIKQGLATFRMEPPRCRWDFGRALFIAALAAMQRGDYDAARRLCEESLAVFRALGQAYGISQALNYLGDLARLQGNYAEAAARYAESLPFVRLTGIKSDLASLLHNLGYVALVQGDAMRAQALFGEGLVLQREIGHQQGLAECLAGCAAVAAEQGDGVWSARLFGVADAICVSAGGPVWPAEQAEYARYRSICQAQLTSEVWEGAWAEGHAMTLAQAIEHALA